MTFAPYSHLVGAISFPNITCKMLILNERKNTKVRTSYSEINKNRDKVFIFINLKTIAKLWTLQNPVIFVRWARF